MEHCSNDWGRIQPDQGDALGVPGPPGVNGSLCVPPPNLTYVPDTGDLIAAPGSSTPVTEVVLGGRRNIIAQPIMDKYGIPVVSTFNSSVGLWWGHNGGDCVHHCLWSAPELWLHSVYMRLRQDGIKGDTPLVTVLPKTSTLLYAGEPRWSVSRAGS